MGDKESSLKVKNKEAQKRHRYLDHYLAAASCDMELNKSARSWLIRSQWTFRPIFCTSIGATPAVLCRERRKEEEVFLKRECTRLQAELREIEQKKLVTAAEVRVLESAVRRISEAPRKFLFASLEIVSAHLFSSPEIVSDHR